MKRSFLILTSWVFVVVLVLGLGVACSAETPAEVVPVSGPSGPTLDNIFLNYSSWTRANEFTIEVPMTMALLCTLTPQQTVDMGHGVGLIDVYVNDFGRTALLEAQPEVFPAGSIIVKEKKTDEGGLSDIGIMIKREEGFSPSTNDWEFGYMEVNARKVRGTDGELAHCAQCHMDHGEQDNVFANYISP